MAEAVVEERATVPPRFYCHMCNVEINIPNATDYTCPHCAGGFVEELPENTPGVGSSASTSGLAVGSDNSSATSLNDTPNLVRISDLEALRGDIAALLTARNGSNLEITIEPGRPRRANVVLAGGGRGASGTNEAGRGNTGGGRVRPNLERLDNVLLDLLHSLPLTNGTDFGNSHMFFMGNPGDYAWGREGIDTIVTQMLNQMETSGPPPLPQQKIDEIAKVTVTADDVEKKMQCSVCWEDFQMHEMVRKLPCAHIYHEQCIVPWLGLHGTCPICRKSLMDEESDESVVMLEELGHHGNEPCPLHGGSRDLGTSQQNATNGTNGSTNQEQQQDQQQQRNGSNSSQTQSSQNLRNAFYFSFDDDNMNLD